MSDDPLERFRRKSVSKKGAKPPPSDSDTDDDDPSFQTPPPRIRSSSASTSVQPVAKLSSASASTVSTQSTASANKSGKKPAPKPIVVDSESDDETDPEAERLAVLPFKRQEEKRKQELLDVLQQQEQRRRALADEQLRRDEMDRQMRLEQQRRDEVDLERARQAQESKRRMESSEFEKLWKGWSPEHRCLLKLNEWLKLRDLAKQQRRSELQQQNSEELWANVRDHEAEIESAKSLKKIVPCAKSTQQHADDVIQQLAEVEQRLADRWQLRIKRKKSVAQLLKIRS